MPHKPQARTTTATDPPYPTTRAYTPFTFCWILFRPRGWSGGPSPHRPARRFCLLYLY